MENKIIIGLVGEMASGKGTVAKYLEDEYQATSHKFSTSLRDILSRLYVDISRENMQALSPALRALFGQDILARVISKDVQNDNNKVIIIDGIRRFADIEYLKELPEFKLVYITADIGKRYERIIKRGENTDELNKTFEQFRKDHEAETELEIPKVGATAHIKIDNNGSLEELYKQIDNIIKSD